MRTLPRQLQHSATLLVTTWGHEPTVVVPSAQVAINI
jgi:hypothetical protein